MEIVKNGSPKDVYNVKVHFKTLKTEDLFMTILDTT